MRAASVFFVAVATVATGLAGAPASAGIQYYVDPVGGNDVPAGGSQRRRGRRRLTR